MSDEQRLRYLRGALDPLERANLIGEVPTLFTVAIVLAWLTPRRGAAS